MARNPSKLISDEQYSRLNELFEQMMIADTDFSLGNLPLLEAYKEICNAGIKARNILKGLK